MLISAYRKFKEIAAYNEFLVMSGHDNNPDPGDDTMEMSGTQSSTIYSESMCSDESSPLLMYTQTRNSTKKSSILYVDKAALYQMQQSQSGSRYVAARSS